MSFYSKTSYSKSESSFYSPIYGNYKFDTSLSDFGIMKERKVRKVNRSGSVLKLKMAKGENSIYPMIDEFGYTFMDFFIFRSTWDQAYHFETAAYDPSAPMLESEPENTDYIIKRAASRERYSIGKPYLRKFGQNE